MTFLPSLYKNKAINQQKQAFPITTLTFFQANTCKRISYMQGETILASSLLNWRERTNINYQTPWFTVN